MAADQNSGAGGNGGGGDDAVDVVDFNALHAALGDLPPPPTSSSNNLAQSEGKNNATYSSTRPHTIPPTRAPVVDPNAPSIVVDDPPPTSVPNMAAQMTIPMGAPVMSGVGAVSAPMPVAPMRPRSPSQPFYTPTNPINADAQQTLHMPGRPIAPPRRQPRSPTMVVRVRGPSGKKKALVFFLMLVLVIGAGVGALAFFRPATLALIGVPGFKPAPTFSPPKKVPAPTAVPVPSN